MIGSFQKIYLFCSRGERMFLVIVQAHLPPYSGASLKGKNLLPLGANSFRKSNPKFDLIQLAPLN